MKKPAPANTKLLKTLTTTLKKLQGDLVTAKRVEGIDEYIAVKIQNNESRFTRTKIENGKDKAIGDYMLDVAITCKQGSVLVPLSISSGKTVTGFMYYIEGTGESTVASATVEVRGDGVQQIAIGTLLYAKIPAGKTATFRLHIIIRGQVGKSYRIICNRLNYKHMLTDSRYQQYLKPISSKQLRFK
jgi:hypothetical protein